MSASKTIPATKDFTMRYASWGENGEDLKDMMVPHAADEFKNTFCPKKACSSITLAFKSSSSIRNSNAAEKYAVKIIRSKDEEF